MIRRLRSFAAFAVAAASALSAGSAWASPEDQRPLFVVPGFFGSELREGDCATGEVIWGEILSIGNADRLRVVDGPIGSTQADALWELVAAADQRDRIDPAEHPEFDEMPRPRQPGGGPALVPCAPLQDLSIMGEIYEIDTYSELARNLGEFGYCVVAFSEADRSEIAAPGNDDRCRDGRPHAYMFAYDWRLSNFRAAHELAIFIEEMLQRDGYADQKTYDLLGHSMGGLIVEIVAKRYTIGERIDGMIAFGTPYLGLISPVISLERGLGDGLSSDLSRLLNGLDEIVPFGLSMPALYEILPRFDGCCWLDRVTRDDLFTSEAAFRDALGDQLPGMGPFMGEWPDQVGRAFDRADALHEILDEHFAAEDCTVRWAVRSATRITDTRIEVQSRIGLGLGRLSTVRSRNGDSVVHRDSAISPLAFVDDSECLDPTEEDEYRSQRHEVRSPRDHITYFDDEAGQRFDVVFGAFLERDFQEQGVDGFAVFLEDAGGSGGRAEIMSASLVLSDETAFVDSDGAQKNVSGVIQLEVDAFAGFRDPLEGATALRLLAVDRATGEILSESVPALADIDLDSQVSFDAEVVIPATTATRIVDILLVHVGADAPTPLQTSDSAAGYTTVARETVAQIHPDDL